MKIRTLLAVAALITTPAFAQVAPNAPQGNPLTVEPAQDAAPVQQDLSVLGSTPAPSSTEASFTWSSLPDTTRHLLIMGTVDGFGAAGAGAPCFPGRNNGSLDQQLLAAGFGDKMSVDLPSELAKLSAPAEQCQSQPGRGYDSSLLTSMTNEHLAHYVSGVVRGYSHVRECPAVHHSYAGSTIVAAIFSAEQPQSPPQLIALGLAAGCQGPDPA